MQKIQSIMMDNVLYTGDDLANYASLLNRNLKANYISFDPAFYAKNVKPTESDLKSYYENTKSTYDHPERARVRHILIAFQGTNESLQGQDPNIVILEGYRKDIMSGKSRFVDLAKKYSHDAGSKKKGGQLGCVVR